MPEEINRILSDHISTLLFCPTQTAMNNLKREGFSLENKFKASIDNPHSYLCGDIMFDNSLYFSAISDEKATILNEETLIDEKIILVTIHRNANTDEPVRLNAIFNALKHIQKSTGFTIVLPIHPRTKKMMDIHLSIENKDELAKNQKCLDKVAVADLVAISFYL
jgi:UDP-GlcNAc3NAcA epimerase